MHELGHSLEIGEADDDSGRLPLSEAPTGSPLTLDPTSVDTDGDGLDEDTDGDGLTDFEENRSTHTDPNATQTYRPTRTHERILNATFADERSNEEFRLKERAGLRREQRPRLQSVEDPDLTDATDDFDFVWLPLGRGL
jgi:hypothetical protein